MSLILQTLYLLLPAYLGNASATISGRWKFLNTPLDHGQKIGADFVLGPNKTYRGTLFCLLVALLTVWLQYFLYPMDFPQKISLIDYRQIAWPILGLLAGLGTTGGDILASFIKRRLSIKISGSIPVLDQLDFIIGFLALTVALIDYTWPVIITALLLTLVIHPLSNIIAYKLKFKRVWW
jgi:CDP-2,3-bis-(O-geranylgeranyl)-sn-glycerol synthase